MEFVSFSSESVDAQEEEEQKEEEKEKESNEASFDANEFEHTCQGFCNAVCDVKNHQTKITTALLNFKRSDFSSNVIRTYNSECLVPLHR